MLELNAGGTVPHLLGHLGHAAFDEAARHHGGVLQVGLAQKRWRSGAGPGRHDRTRHRRIFQTELQHGIAAHAQPNEMRPFNAEGTHHRRDIVTGKFPAVLIEALGHIARWIAARIVGDATITSREVPHLGFPLAMIGAEFVDKHNRISAPGVLVMQLDAVSIDGGHGNLVVVFG